MAGIPGIGAGGPSIAGLGGGNPLGAVGGGQNPLDALKQIPGMEELMKKLLEMLKQGGAQGAQGGGAPQGGAPQGAAPAGGAAQPSAAAEGAPSGMEDIMSQIIKKLKENPELAQQVLGAMPPQLRQALGAALQGGGAQGGGIAAAAGKR